MLMQPRNPLKVLRLVAAAAVLGVLVAPAGAVAEAPDTPAVAVRYGDLDLGRDTDVQALYTRLRAAAARVCGPVETRDLARHAAWRECRDSALARAVDQLGNARLAALHRGRPYRASAGAG